MCYYNYLTLSIRENDRERAGEAQKGVEQKLNRYYILNNGILIIIVIHESRQLSSHLLEPPSSTSHLPTLVIIFLNLLHRKSKFLCYVAYSLINDMDERSVTIAIGLDSGHRVLQNLFTGNASI